MLLKALTFMSSASFVISKMSLITSVLLGFKWFLANNSNNNMQPQRMPEAAKVEIVHVPMKKFNDWDREVDKSSVPVTSYDNNYENYYDHDIKPTQYL